MARTLLMVGTRKGLWLGTSDEARTSWSWTGPHFPMEEVYSVMLDRRSSPARLLAGASSSWFGPQVRRSDDLGATWEETPNGAIRFPEGSTQPDGSPATLERVFHTILPHPDDPQRMLVAISTGGVYVTADGGNSWAASNTGVKAEFFPGERNYPEFGQCVHKVARDPLDPERLYLQNHGGVYRSDDGGDSWQDIAPGLPAEFGFVMVPHPHRGDTIHTFPIADAGARWPVDGKARVYRSTDAGESWSALGDGQLPDHYFSAVMRDAMCVDDHETPGLYFGGRSGSVWCSPDDGDTWAELQSDLPDVLVVRAARID